MTAASRPTASRADLRLVRVLVRLVEGAVLVLLLGAAHELWSAWQNAGFDGFLGRSGPVLLDRVWSVVHNQSRGPVAAVVAAVLLAGCLWVAQRSGEQRSGGREPAAPDGVRSVRVELAVLAGIGLLLALAEVAVVVVAAAMPYGPERGPSPLLPGEDQLAALLPVAAWPLAAVLLYAALGCLWWLLRPRTVEAPSLEGAPAQVKADELNRVEAPAEKLERLSSDGSTTNGYEEYFRRS